MLPLISPAYIATLLQTTYITSWKYMYHNGFSDFLGKNTDLLPRNNSFNTLILLKKFKNQINQWLLEKNLLI